VTSTEQNKGVVATISDSDCCVLLTLIVSFPYCVFYYTTYNIMERSGKEYAPPGIGISVISPGVVTRDLRVLRSKSAWESMAYESSDLSSQGLLGLSPYGRLPHPKLRRQLVFNSVPTLCSFCGSVMTKTRCTCSESGGGNSSSGASSSRNIDNEGSGKRSVVTLARLPVVDIASRYHPTDWLDIRKERSSNRDLIRPLISLTAQLDRHYQPFTTDSLKYLPSILSGNAASRRSLLGPPKLPLEPLSGPLGETVRNIKSSTLIDVGTSDLPSWIRRALKSPVGSQWTADGRYIVWICKEFAFVIDPFKNINDARYKLLKHNRIIGAIKFHAPISTGSLHPMKPNLLFVVGEARSSPISSSTKNKKMVSMEQPGAIYVYNIRGMKLFRKTLPSQIGGPAIPVLVSSLEKMPLPKHCLFNNDGSLLVVASGVFRHERLEAFKIDVDLKSDGFCEISTRIIGSYDLNDDFNERSISFSQCGRFLRAPLKERKELAIFTVNKDEAFKKEPFLMSTGFSGVQHTCSSPSGDTFYASESASVIHEYSTTAMAPIGSIRGLGPSSLHVTSMGVNCTGEWIAWAPELGTSEAKEFEVSLQSSGEDTRRSSVSTGPRIFIGRCSPLKPLFGITADAPVKSLNFHPVFPNIMFYTTMKTDDNNLNCYMIQFVQ